MGCEGVQDVGRSERIIGAAVLLVVSAVLFLLYTTPDRSVHLSTYVLLAVIGGALLLLWEVVLERFSAVGAKSWWMRVLQYLFGLLLLVCAYLSVWWFTSLM